ncbi:MAG: penicillin acylase family protein [Bacteroidota bacterium]
MCKSFLFFCCVLLVCLGCFSQNNQTIQLPGLIQPVEVIRDENGVNHIYAQNEHDLFFAQGYCAAKDRLFQFEMWRRQATGTVAEILGPRELKRDQGARLFKFRGDLKNEFAHYHPRGEQIINAFTNGINAYIAEAIKNPKQLPLEFKLLGIKPGKWTPEIVISRHQGLLGNLPDELTYAKAVSLVGEQKLKEIQNFEPGDPDLKMDQSIDPKLLFNNVTELYDAFRKPITFMPEDLVSAQNKKVKKVKQAVNGDDYTYRYENDRQIIGSNNWIVSGQLSASGNPMLANDPHRAIAAPSLRYMVHLNAPGWNVVGGGEPTIPGVSIGHNEYGAWGLTVFALDGEDLYVYELNPNNPLQYKYKVGWETMRVIRDTLKGKGTAPVVVEHRYTRHGPVTYVDEKNHVAFAVRCAWMEVGGAPYMASLRIDQATSLAEFKKAVSYSHIPGENMIWADKKGNIAWQAAGIAPIRKNWSGLVPVPGDGRYEWSGYLPIDSLPRAINPDKGFWATANENLIPKKYPHRDAVGWNWADPFRAQRINEVLGGQQKFSMEDMKKLQFDYLSLPAKRLVPLLKSIPIETKTKESEDAKEILLNWDFVLDKNSVAATVYMAWEKQLVENLSKKLIPDNVNNIIKTIPLSKTISTLENSTGLTLSERNLILVMSLTEAMIKTKLKLGSDKSKWQYGQTANHHVWVKHPLSNVVDDVTRKKLEVGPLPRGGNGSTPGMTTNLDNQLAGASFRMVVDVGDWDGAYFTNSPGQSGEVGNRFYNNLFERWANDIHFPVYFTKEKVKKAAANTFKLKP